MRTLRYLLSMTLLMGCAVSGIQAGVEGLTEIRVDDLESLRSAQQLVGPSAPQLGGAITIRLGPGDFLLEDSFHIARSRVSLIGEAGTRLILADGVNKPVLAIGSQVEHPVASDQIERIVVANLEIDGNLSEQDSEVSRMQPWIRNNGIDVRAVRHLTVAGVSAGNNRSGGLVISWDSSDVRVEDSVFEGNFFDGVAYYASADVVTRNCTMRGNGFAGISLDNRMVKSRFEGCRVESNGAVGVFARNSVGLRFDNCVIEDSADWGVFLAHDEKARGVHDIEFAVCEIANNHGGLFMASVDDDQSSGTRVVSSAFRGNGKDGRSNIQTSGSTIWTVGLVELP
ncbi:MAG: right-handed parallel beta-helix repeat-containing protein [Opitutaceae bacterium]